MGDKEQLDQSHERMGMGEVVDKEIDDEDTKKEKRYAHFSIYGPEMVKNVKKLHEILANELPSARKEINTSDYGVPPECYATTFQDGDRWALIGGNKDGTISFSTRKGYGPGGNLWTHVEITLDGQIIKAWGKESTEMGYSYINDGEERAMSAASATTEEWVDILVNNGMIDRRKEYEKIFEEEHQKITRRNRKYKEDEEYLHKHSYESYDGSSHAGFIMKDVEQTQRSIHLLALFKLSGGKIDNLTPDYVTPPVLDLLRLDKNERDEIERIKRLNN